MRRATTAITAVCLVGVLASCGSPASEAGTDPTPVSPGAPAAKSTGPSAGKAQQGDATEAKPSTASAAPTSASPSSTTDQGAPETQSSGSAAVKDRAAPTVPLAQRGAKPAKPTESAGKESLNGTVTFSDGVRLKITAIKSGKSDQQALPGNFPDRVMTTFTVKLSNGSKARLDANSVIVTATYGDASTVATPVFDKTASPFTGVLAPKATETATYGFNIPASERGKVTLRFDLDGKHSMATFTGDAS